jgi:hypothetical protein
VNFVDSFKDDLLATKPRRRALRRLPIPVMVALALAALAIPAWAAGLFGNAFPEDHEGRAHYPDVLGHRYVLDTGRTTDGRRFRLIGWRMLEPPLPRGLPGKRQVMACVEIQVRPSVTPGAVGGSLGESCQGRIDPHHPVNFYDMGIKALGGRRIHAGMLPASATRVRITWFSGKHVDLVPNRPNPARLRASHLGRPFAYVAIVPPPGDRFKGADVMDAHGRLIDRVRNPAPLRAGEHVPRTTSPLLDLRRYLGQP